MLVLLLLLLSDSSLASPELSMSEPQKHIFEEVSWPLKLMLIKENFIEEDPRPVSIQAQQLPVTAASSEDPPKMAAHRRQGTDDNDMKLKLFRLMYESVRDSDLKVKRAELINSYYVNSTAFEIGYLLGDITEKYNIMSDISLTLKRLYNDWKPIEHINAYEQIASLSIEMNHLIEIIRSVHNKNPIHETPDS